MKPNVIVIHPGDNVAVALEDIPAGAAVYLPDGQVFAALTAIPYSHKVALADLVAGAVVVKYGETIGEVTEDVRRGDWIHVHNLDIEEQKENS
ncbi:MAG: UxaA family hydrolase [Syntrophales bacterium]|nr:UxaA family hydrolase [Syntrophales bacterium]MDD4338931.1 UxaA family hydrolase [Syntrophales bacterium]HOG08211.1 UxaA family hydrolase [Syntrophales bacterium]HOS78138.1 UxaA family hydrolase [Syntrophales bacterium]HPB69527.1 UxaA family hydrolase [Syntrophales bacterium]